MSLRDQARQMSEYARRVVEEKRDTNTDAMDALRATEQWRDTQTRLGNAIIKKAPDLIKRRAEDGHVTAWIMDISPDQFADREYPHPLEMPLEVCQVNLFGAARIVSEYLCREGFTVVLRHTGSRDGVNYHRLDAEWVKKDQIVGG